MILIKLKELIIINSKDNYLESKMLI